MTSSTAGLKARLVKGGLGSLGARIAQAGLGLLISIALARILGPEGVGSYGTTIAILAIVIIPMQAGVARLTIREAARKESQADWSGLSGLLSWINWATIAFTIACFAALVGLGEAARAWSSSWLQVVALGFAAAPLMAIGYVHAGVLTGLKKVVRGQSFEVGRNALMLVSLIVLPLVVSEISVLHAIAAFALANLGAGLLSVILTRRALPAEVKQVENGRQTEGYFRQVVPFAMMGGIWTLISSMDIIALGYFSSSSEVGYFHIANQVCSLLLFGLTAIGLVASPYFASLHSSGDMNALQILARRSAQASLLFAGAGAAFLWASSAFLVPLVFGAEFAPSVWPISILAIGFDVQSSTGASAAMLAMTGHEQKTIRSTLIALACKVVALLLLVPSLGAVGVAVAVVTYFVVFNILVRRACLSALGIEVFALK